MKQKLKVRHTLIINKLASSQQHFLLLKSPRDPQARHLIPYSAAELFIGQQWRTEVVLTSPKVWICANVWMWIKVYCTCSANLMVINMTSCNITGETDSLQSTLGSALIREADPFFGQWSISFPFFLPPSFYSSRHHAASCSMMMYIHFVMTSDFLYCRKVQGENTE